MLQYNNAAAMMQIFGFEGFFLLVYYRKILTGQGSVGVAG